MCGRENAPTLTATLGESGDDVHYYRLYVLSAPDGRFIGFEEIQADDDVAAVRSAERFAGDRPLELWCGSRKVRSIPARPRPSSPSPRAGTKAAP
jgi:hypothetical protein